MGNMVISINGNFVYTNLGTNIMAMVQIFARYKLRKIIEVALQEIPELTINPNNLILTNSM